MRERPILMSGPMVRAILAGTKTQTRRPVNPQPVFQFGCWFPNRGHKRALHYANQGHFRHGMPRDFSPFGQPGDRLWVRETWGQDEALCEGVQYRASWPQEEIEHAAENTEWRWRPSIHMPRWACRLVPEIVSVRVERLEDITEANARAEGFESRAAFLAAYRAMYKLPPDANPWVWGVEFKRVEVKHAG